MGRARRIVAPVLFPLLLGGCLRAAKGGARAPVPSPAHPEREAAGFLYPELPSLPEPVAHGPRPHDYDVEHYRVSLTVEPSSGRIDGSVAVRFRPTVPDFSRLVLDAAELDVHTVEEEGGGALRWETEGDRLLVDLARGRPLGEPVTVVVRYTGFPRRGMYFLGPDRDHPDRPVQVFTQGEPEDTRYWIPCWDFPNDRATSELEVTVPAGLTTVAAGALVGREEDRERRTRTDRWRMEADHVSYLFTLVVGEHVIVEDRGGEVPLWYVVERADEPLARPTFGKTPAILGFFSEWLGVPYPYAKYAQVCVREPLFGGMENVTAATLSRAALHEESLAADAPATGLVAHELAHQWFGDLLTCADWSHLWLNEGFASYFDLLYTERAEGWDEFRLGVRRSQKAYAEQCRGEARRPVVWNRYVDPVDLLDAHVYAGGASRLDLLRFLLGDEEFRRAVQAWVREYRGRCVTTEDFRRCLEAQTGRDLRAFFDDWFYAAGYPEFRVRATYDEGASSVLVRIEQVQAVEKGTPAVFRAPVEIAVLTGAERRLSFRVPIEAREQTVVLPVEGRPLLVRFDPASRIPKRLEFEKDVEELRFQLARDPDVVGRIEAAEALSRLGSGGREGGSPGAEADAEGPGAPAVAGPSIGPIVEALAESLGTDPFHGVREAAAAALGEVRGEAARDALARALGNPDGRVRRAACAALGAFGGDRSALGALGRALQSDPSPYTAAAAAAAIGKATGEGAFDLLVGQIGRPAHNEVVRAAVYGALGALGDERAIPYLLQGASPRAPEPARAAAVAALGRTGIANPEVVAALGEFLLDSSFSVRRAAAAALGETGDPVVAGMLLSRLKEESDGRVRSALAESVRRIRREGLARGIANPALSAEVARRRAALERLEAEEETAEAEAAEARARVEEIRARRGAAAAELERLGVGTREASRRP
ncbi:MAG TPA: M1 family aminopeptidase [Planctomycetota bacterium]|jgi:aminopeptidase N|nr:M1 family aminopeptidase [Planctomycetota bacterium]